MHRRLAWTVGIYLLYFHPKLISLPTTTRNFDEVPGREGTQEVVCSNKNVHTCKNRRLYNTLRDGQYSRLTGLHYEPKQDSGKTQKEGNECIGRFHV